VSFQAIKTWKISTDSDFEAKKNRILYLYDVAAGKASTQPGDPHVVICMDEFRPSTCSLTPASTGPPRAARTRPRGAGEGPPTRARAVSDTCSPATTSRATASKVTSRCTRGRTEFLAFCRYIRILYPKEIRIALVRDNFSLHLSTNSDPRVGDWVAANNVELAYMPTNASWVNRIEGTSPPSVTSRSTAPTT
jgi:hypothetical protein